MSSDAMGVEPREAAVMTPLQERFRAVVADLAVGEVVSYGEVARRAGRPGAGRSVGGFLAEHGSALPWWRVVRADGTLASPNRREQERRLGVEGVEVVGDRVVDALPDR